MRIEGRGPTKNLIKQGQAPQWIDLLKEQNTPGVEVKIYYLNNGKKLKMEGRTAIQKRAQKK